jgi:uncharacterized protein (TIGR02246 family)
MRVRNVPQDVTCAFAQAISAAEPDRALSFFAEDGCFVTPDATAVTGSQGIRAILVQLTGGQVQLQVELKGVQSARGMAICNERWTFTYARKDADPFTQVSDSTVLLCHSNGVWKLLIAAPWVSRPPIGSFRPVRDP